MDFLGQDSWFLSAGSVFLGTKAAAGIGNLAITAFLNGRWDLE